MAESIVTLVSPTPARGEFIPMGGEAIGGEIGPRLQSSSKEKRDEQSNQAIPPRSDDHPDDAITMGATGIVPPSPFLRVRSPPSRSASTASVILSGLKNGIDAAIYPADSDHSLPTCPVDSPDLSPPGYGSTNATRTKTAPSLLDRLRPALDSVARTVRESPIVRDFPPSRGDLQRAVYQKVPRISTFYVLEKLSVRRWRGVEGR